MEELSDYIFKAGLLNTNSDIISANALGDISAAIEEKQDALSEDQISAINSINDISATADSALQKAEEVSASLSDYVLKSDLSAALTAAGIDNDTELSNMTLGNCISALFEIRNLLMHS